MKAKEIACLVKMVPRALTSRVIEHVFQGEMCETLVCCLQWCKAVVLKLFHVEDPQIGTFQSADPKFKRYPREL